MINFTIQRGKLQRAFILLLLLSSALSFQSKAATETIDVMVLYTDEMLSETADPDTRVAAMIEWMNAAMQASNADLVARLVHSQKIDFANDSKTDEAALYALTDNTTVAKLRSQYGADMVALITDTGPYCGIAWVPGGQDGELRGRNAAFSVTGSLCISAFSHELGHNMGLGHSAAQGQEGSLHSWARGHGIDGNFVTTMAYGSAYSTNTTVQRFSTPDINSCNGQACGVSIDQKDGADAARGLNQVAAEVAAYFPSNTDNSDDNDDSEETDDTEDTQAPSKPGELSASEISTDGLLLSWVGSTDNIAVDHYDIFRDASKVASATQTKYADGGLAADAAYTYTVQAIDAAGNISAISNELDVHTEAEQDTSDTTAPSVPENLHVSGKTTSSISLEWHAASDDTEVTAYAVYRDAVLLATVANTAYDDADENLTEGVSYHYHITAQDAAGNQSAASALLQATLEVDDSNDGGDDEEDDSNEDDGTDTDTDTGTGSDAANLLQNGAFDELDGWRRVAARINQSADASIGENALLLEHRRRRTSGIYQRLDATQISGGEYVFALDAKLVAADDETEKAAEEANEAPLASVLYVREGRRWKIYPLTVETINDQEWLHIEGQLELPEGLQASAAMIYIYGPPRGVDVLIDEVMLKPAAADEEEPEQPEEPEDEDPSEEDNNVVINPGFEVDVDGWTSLFGGDLRADSGETSENGENGENGAHSGESAAKLSRRRHSVAGISQDLSQQLTPETSYTVSAWMKYVGSQDAQSLHIYLYYQTDEQSRGHWQRISSTRHNVEDEWVELSAELSLPAGSIAKAQLLAFGPRRGVDVYLDDVRIEPVSAEDSQ